MGKNNNENATSHVILIADDITVVIEYSGLLSWFFKANGLQMSCWTGYESLCFYIN